MARFGSGQFRRFRSAISSETVQCQVSAGTQTRVCVRN